MASKGRLRAQAERQAAVLANSAQRKANHAAAWDMRQAWRNAPKGADSWILKVFGTKRARTEQAGPIGYAVRLASGQFRAVIRLG